MGKQPPKPDPAATWEPIGSLTPWDRNPRRNEAAIPQVAKSIERFGFGAPILARSTDRVIIAGHTRWLAAKSVGLDKVPVRFLDLDPAEAHALALADNKLAEIAEWDDDALASVLTELDGAGVAVDDLGWAEEDLAAILGAEPDPEPAEEDKVPTIWQVLVECGDEAGQARVLDLLMAEGLTCRALTS